MMAGTGTTMAGPNPKTDVDEIEPVTDQVTEGRATVLFPKGNVFYNPAQRFNRDLSVAVIKTYTQYCLPLKQKPKVPQRDDSDDAHSAAGSYLSYPSSTKSVAVAKDYTILEPLAASGLRAIRYALEIPAIKCVYANDRSESALEWMGKNIEHNKVPLGVIETSCSDANALMWSRNTKRVDIIDLDPYGTAAPFIDAAIQAVGRDGLLCVTCTDMIVAAGAGYPEKCFTNYGGLPVKQQYTHEVVVSSCKRCLMVGYQIGLEFNCYDSCKVWTGN
jgi:tRNA (guanine26-N2/guanine27-N2)-dimethyltransferase